MLHAGKREISSSHWGVTGTSATPDQTLCPGVVGQRSWGKHNTFLFHFGGGLFLVGLFVCFGERERLREREKKRQRERAPRHPPPPLEFPGRLLGGSGRSGCAVGCRSPRLVDWLFDAFGPIVWLHRRGFHRSSAGGIEPSYKKKVSETGTSLRRAVLRPVLRLCQHDQRGGRGATRAPRAHQSRL